MEKLKLIFSSSYSKLLESKENIQKEISSSSDNKILEPKNSNNKRSILQENAYVRGNIDKFLHAQYEKLAVVTLSLCLPITTKSQLLSSIKSPSRVSSPTNRSVIDSSSPNRDSVINSNKCSIYVITVNKVSVTLSNQMILNPNIITHQKYEDYEHDNTFSIYNKDGKYIYIKLGSKESFNKWYKELRSIFIELLYWKHYSQPISLQSFRFVEQSAINTPLQKLSALLPDATIKFLFKKLKERLELRNAASTTVFSFELSIEEFYDLIEQSKDLLIHSTDTNPSMDSLPSNPSLSAVPLDMEEVCCCTYQCECGIFTRKMREMNSQTPRTRSQTHTGVNESMMVSTALWLDPLDELEEASSTSISYLNHHEYSSLHYDTTLLPGGETAEVKPLLQSTSPSAPIDDVTTNQPTPSPATIPSQWSDDVSSAQDDVFVRPDTTAPVVEMVDTVVEKPAKEAADHHRHTSIDPTAIRSPEKDAKTHHSTELESHSPTATTRLNASFDPPDVAATIQSTPSSSAGATLPEVCHSIPSSNHVAVMVSDPSSPTPCPVFSSQKDVSDPSSPTPCLSHPHCLPIKSVEASEAQPHPSLNSRVEWLDGPSHGMGTSDRGWPSMNMSTVSIGIDGIDSTLQVSSDSTPPSTVSSNSSSEDKLPHPRTTSSLMGLTASYFDVSSVSLYPTEEPPSTRVGKEEGEGVLNPFDRSLDSASSPVTSSHPPSHASNASQVPEKDGCTSPSPMKESSLLGQLGSPMLHLEDHRYTDALSGNQAVSVISWSKVPEVLAEVVHLLSELARDFESFKLDHPPSKREESSHRLEWSDAGVRSVEDLSIGALYNRSQWSANASLKFETNPLRLRHGRRRDATSSSKTEGIRGGRSSMVGMQLVRSVGTEDQNDSSSDPSKQYNREGVSVLRDGPLGSTSDSMLIQSLSSGSSETTVCSGFPHSDQDTTPPCLRNPVALIRYPMSPPKEMMTSQNVSAIVQLSPNTLSTTGDLSDEDCLDGSWKRFTGESSPLPIATMTNVEGLVWNGSSNVTCSPVVRRSSNHSRTVGGFVDHSGDDGMNQLEAVGSAVDPFPVMGSRCTDHESVLLGTMTSGKDPVPTASSSRWMSRWLLGLGVLILLALLLSQQRFQSVHPNQSDGSLLNNTLSNSPSHLVQDQWLSIKTFSPSFSVYPMQQQQQVSVEDPSLLPSPSPEDSNGPHPSSIQQEVEEVQQSSLSLNCPPSSSSSSSSSLWCPGDGSSGGSSPWSTCQARYDVQFRFTSKSPIHFLASPSVGRCLIVVTPPLSVWIEQFVNQVSKWKQQLQRFIRHLVERFPLTHPPYYYSYGGQDLQESLYYYSHGVPSVQETVARPNRGLSRCTKTWQSGMRWFVIMATGMPSEHVKILFEN